MTSSLISMRNLDFLLWEWLDLESLLRRQRFAAHTRADLSVMHGIDLVTRKLRRDGGAAFVVLHERVRSSLAQAAGRPALEAGAGVVAETFQRLATSVHRLIAEQEERRVLANASAFLHALGHGVVG